VKDEAKDVPAQKYAHNVYTLGTLLVTNA
jgi:hypothetical protein